MSKMQILTRILIPTLVPIILGLILSIIDKSNDKEIVKSITKEHIVIRLPIAYLWVGCLEISFFVTCIVLMTWFPNGTATAWEWILFVLLAFIGVAIVLKTQIWKIEIFRSKNYFICRTLPYKTYRILYSDCMSYRFGANTLELRTKEKTFHIDTHATNFEFMLAMLIQHKIRETN